MSLITSIFLALLGGVVLILIAHGFIFAYKKANQRVASGSMSADTLIIIKVVTAIVLVLLFAILLAGFEELTGISLL